MNRVRAFGLFWWDFVVGDDYRLALGVVLLLGLTAGLVHVGVALWWLPPLGVLSLLALSVAEAAWRQRRSAGRLRPH